MSLHLSSSADLGHQTAQRIVHASDPLQSMQEINQNFPSVVSSLSRMKVKYAACLVKLKYFWHVGIVVTYIKCCSSWLINLNAL